MTGIFLYVIVTTGVRYFVTTTKTYMPPLKQQLSKPYKIGLRMLAIIKKEKDMSHHITAYQNYRKASYIAITYL